MSETQLYATSGIEWLFSRRAMTNCLPSLFAVGLEILVCASLVSAAEADLSDVQVVIENEVIIAPASAQLRAQNIVRGPDGTIWINTADSGLLKSMDLGRTWSKVPVNLPDAPLGQKIKGFNVTRDGRLWIMHQRDDLGFVSYSSDEGRSWKSSRINYAKFAPGAPAAPYASMHFEHPDLIERPDGTLMFSCSMRYPDWADYKQADQTRPGIRDVMIRTTDGGKTWGDPTVVHQHATETDYAIDPGDPDHIFAATRIQRKALPGEDPIEILKQTGVTYPPDSYIYKNGLLLESTDGGRSFREVPGGLMGFGSYRWSTVWTKENWLILASFSGKDPGDAKFDNDRVVRISLDGGRRWLDGTTTGTPSVREAKKFTVIPAYRDVGQADHYSDCVPATVELARNRFMTLCRYKRERIFKGRIWRLENLPAR